MEECTLEAALEKARTWQAQDKSWHFHLLTPDCWFNPRQDQYALVLENNTDAQTRACYALLNLTSRVCYQYETKSIPQRCK
jgi:hypothetical protein